MNIYLSDTGETVKDDSPYIKKYRKYFASEEGAKKWKSNYDYRTLCIDEFIKVFRYKKGEVIPKILFKKMKEYEPNAIGYPILLETIKYCEENINWALDNKEFKNEIGKISYVFAIISNNIHDVAKGLSRKQKANNVQEKNNINIDTSLTEHGCKQNKKDLSRFII